LAKPRRCITINIYIYVHLCKTVYIICTYVQEIRRHHPSSPAIASRCPVIQTSPATFVVVAVMMVVAFAVAVALAVAVSVALLVAVTVGGGCGGDCCRGAGIAGIYRPAVSFFLKNLLYKCLNQKLRWIPRSLQIVHFYFLVDLTTSLQGTSWGISPGKYSIFWYSTGSTLLEISSFWK
jgi:hypothetical protein